MPSTLLPSEHSLHGLPVSYRESFLRSHAAPLLSPEVPPSPVKSSPETTPTTSPRQRRDSDRFCQLCNAWFNNPGMAQQHYDGKKHKKNAARADLLEQLGKTLDMGEMKGKDQDPPGPTRTSGVRKYYWTTWASPWT